MQIEFLSDSRLIDPAKDKCLHWLQDKYKTVNLQSDTPDGTSDKESLKKRVKSEVKNLIQNDVAVCNQLVWTRFAFPSEPYTPLRSNYTGDSGKTEVKASVKVHTAKDADTKVKAAEKIVVSLTDEKKSKSETSKALTSWEEEPSRNIFRETLYKERLEKFLVEDKELHEANGAASERPLLGGYVENLSRKEDGCRFLLFPQAQHSLFSVEGEAVLSDEQSQSKRKQTPQAVPYFVKGSVYQDMESFNPATTTVPSKTAEETNDGSLGKWLRDGIRWWDSWRLNLSAVAKVDGEVPLRLVESNLSIHNQKTERRLDESKGKVVKCSMEEESLEVIYGEQQDPRYTGRVQASHYTVSDHKKSEKKSKKKDASFEENGGLVHQNIFALQWQERYNSAKQTSSLPSWWPAYFRRSCKGEEKTTTDESAGEETPASRKDTHYTYSVLAEAGPGVEVLGGSVATVYGAFSSQAYVEVPLPRRFNLLLRNQSSLVCPFDPLERKFVACDKKEAEGDASQEGNASGWRRHLRPHDYFWATKGPKWEANLVRGFSNDYSSMHHAKYWYSVFSAELGREKQRKEASETRRSYWQSFRDSSLLKAFFNVCFTDTVREYPRASVGVSVTSKVPRLTVDVFNNILPSTFECSFSWFVDFDKKKLKRGLQPGGDDAAQFIRISPSETFRHMKCGATWKFE